MSGTFLLKWVCHYAKVKQTCCVVSLGCSSRLISIRKESQPSMQRTQAVHASSQLVAHSCARHQPSSVTVYMKHLPLPSCISGAWAKPVLREGCRNTDSTAPQALWSHCSQTHAHSDTAGFCARN